LVAAKGFGVAKNAYIRAVKVLGGDCSKNGTWADVIEGIDWVKANHIKPAVANMPEHDNARLTRAPRPRPGRSSRVRTRRA